MGDRTKENPFTQEDVLKKIEENGGTARDLDLSDKTFEEGIDLQGLNLEGIILKDARFPTHFEGNQLIGAKFNGSNLTAADFRNINLQYAQFGMLNGQPTCLEAADLRGTILLNANFQGADLSCAKFGKVENEDFRPAMLENTDFRKANLFRANFICCHFYRTKLEGAYIRGADITIHPTRLGEADWGNYKIGEEISGDFYNAQHRYRHLKMWYTESGYYDIAGEFFYREMEAKRKGIKWWPNPQHRAWVEFVSFICGYGERPFRVIGWAASVVLGLALIYFAAGSVWEWGAFWSSLYFSAVSFTALGYGSWLWTTNDWIKGIGAFESFIGVFTIALFLVTFTRKMRR